MRFLDDRTGEIHRLFDTSELTADLEAHSAEFDCAHSETNIRRRLVSGGAIQICRQCSRCGRAIGGAIRRNPSHEGIATFDESVEHNFELARKAKLQTICLKHLALQNRREASYQREYDAYLASPEWQNKRQKVLERAKNVCEGCCEKPAEQVHHLTYRHVFNEFMFELVALCKSCHERFHEDEVEGDKDGVNESIEPPCCGCRWQDERGTVDWCGKFDTSIAFAMAASGPCGPKQSELEGLR